MSESIPWPRAGDQLFGAADDWENNACVGFSREQWVGYIEGYKLAADKLAETVTTSGRDQDFLVYPIVFLYRHAIEIALKYLIRLGCRLLDTEPSKLIDHKLSKLWLNCRPLLEQVWPEGPKEDLDAVGDVIAQFETEDPTAAGYRYPTDTKGQPFHTQHRVINLRNFAEVANRVLGLLDGCTMGISVYLDHKQELEMELEQYHRG